MRVLSLVLAVLFALTIPVAAWADGSKFKLTNPDKANAARVDEDPENAVNDVVKIVTTAGYPKGAGAMIRTLGRNVKVADLQNMLSAKYYFVGRTCAGGSPRFQILIESPLSPYGIGNAFGYLGDQPWGGGCPAGVWTYEDMTNATQKWDLSQFGGGMTMSWAQVIAFFAADPDHVVRACGLVDDSGSFAAGAVGTAYYDNVQCFDRILEDKRDTTR
jgi:hypothetical protein